MQHILCFLDRPEAEKALILIRKKGFQDLQLKGPEEDGSCSIHLSTDEPLTEQQDIFLTMLGAQLLMLDFED